MIIEAVCPSQLRRALDTAKCVAEHDGLDVGVADDLVDFDYGREEGLTHPQVEEYYFASEHGGVRGMQFVHKPREFYEKGSVWEHM